MDTMNAKLTQSNFKDNVGTMRLNLNGECVVNCACADITDFDEVVKLDLEYIDNWSVGLDIKILFMTVYTVLFRRGAV